MPLWPKINLHVFDSGVCHRAALTSCDLIWFQCKICGQEAHHYLKGLLKRLLYQVSSQTCFFFNMLITLKSFHQNFQFKALKRGLLLIRADQPILATGALFALLCFHLKIQFLTNKSLIISVCKLGKFISAYRSNITAFIQLI